MELQPLWRKVSTSKVVRCEDGDPFNLILTRINDLIIQGAESLVNFLIDGVNDFVESLPWPLSAIGRPIKRVCFPTGYDPSRCIGGYPTPEQLAKLARCEDSSFGLEEMVSVYRRTLTLHTRAYFVVCARSATTLVCARYVATKKC